MKIGDLVALSAKGKSQDQNWKPNYYSSFGIVVGTQNGSVDPLFVVQWFAKKNRTITNANLVFRHCRYELKHHKQPQTSS